MSLGALMLGVGMYALRKSQQEPTGYGAVPTRYDPNVFAAGRAAARQTINTAPRGTDFSGTTFATRLPLLMGGRTA